jgi:cystathionine beta-lyase
VGAVAATLEEMNVIKVPSDPTPVAGGDDPFGLDGLELDALLRRPGAKWHRAHGRLAAWVADMDFPIAPPIREALEALVREDVGYPDWPEISHSPLRQTFAARMADRHAWSPSVDRLHELSDVVQGVQIAVHHLSQPGDAVVMHTPAYPPFFAAVEGLGRRVLDVPGVLVDGRWSFDYDELDRRLAEQPARLMILCHPHNPLGRVFPRTELERIADVAARHGLIVISDEIHAELVHPPHGHLPFAALGPDVEAITVTITSASKAFNLAGLRWAILHAGSDALQDVLTTLPDHYLGAPSALAVAATDAAWSDGDAWLAAVRERLDRNRRELAGLLATHVPDVGYVVPEATYLAWLDFRRAGLGDDPAAAMRERGVQLSSGPTFGPEGRGFARLNFATSAQVLRTIVRTMGERSSPTPAHA